LEQPQIKKIRVRIREASWVARIASWKLREKQVAMVFGRTVHLCRTGRKEFLSDPDWVCHEIIHVLQYQRYGRLGFLWRYLLESAKSGYYENRLEKEARAGEKDHSLLQRVTFV
jgi:hypothetical protein